MKCKFCDGSGKDYWCLNGVPYPCPVCNGTGEIKDEPLTNEEWLHTLNTEQLAEVFADVSLWIHPFMKQKNRFELLKKQFHGWLKEKHNA